MNADCCRHCGTAARACSVKEMRGAHRVSCSWCAAKSILRQNRHSTLKPFKWYGPDKEPCPPGEGCDCPGCEAARYISEDRGAPAPMDQQGEASHT